MLLENDFDFLAESTDILNTIDKQEQEKSEWKEEQFRRHNLDDKKKEIFSLLIGKPMSISDTNICISRKLRLQDI